MCKNLWAILMILDKATLKTECSRGFRAQILMMLGNILDLWRRLTQDIPCHTKEGICLHMPFQRQEAMLDPFTLEIPMFVVSHSPKNNPVEWVSCQIRRGVIPALLDLAEVFPVDSDAPQFQQLLNQFHYFLAQAGELGNLRGLQLRLALGLCSRRNILRELKSSLITEEANNLGLESRIEALNTLIHETENALTQSLLTDPCMGDSIHLNAQWQAYPRWIQKPLRWLDSIRAF
jgi:hypothetical protein